MDSKHEETIKAKVDRLLEKIVDNNTSGEIKKNAASGEIKKNAARQLWDFFCTQPQEKQDTIVEYILLFAQSKASGVTDKKLFCLAYAFFACVNELNGTNHGVNDRFLGLQNGLGAICKRRFGKNSPTVKFLTDISEGASPDHQTFQQKLKNFEEKSPLEKLMEDKKTQVDSSSTLKNEIVSNLTDYRDKLFSSEWNRKNLITQAVKNLEGMSDADFLINFQIAYRVFEKYPTSKERKAILRSLFEESHPFRPLIDLFANEKVRFEVSGKSIAYHSLEKIFQHINAECLKLFVKDDVTLNQAIADRIMDDLIRTNMSHSGNEIVKGHALFKVLMGLIAVGVITVDQKGEIKYFLWTGKALGTLVDKFAAIYFTNRSVEEGDFTTYLISIIGDVKRQISNLKDPVVDQDILFKFLDEMIIHAKSVTFDAYKIAKSDAVTTSTLKGGPIINTGVPTFFSSPNTSNTSNTSQGQTLAQNEAQQDTQSSEESGGVPRPGSGS
jgi:hypothetical protein